MYRDNNNNKKAASSSGEKDESNYKAMGVCYNNIANVHLKNGKYRSAETSFSDAIRCALICKEKTDNPDQD